MNNRIRGFVVLLRNGAALWRGRRSLRLRLIAFLLLFVIVIMLALAVVLFASGVFSAGLNESRLFVENELAHISVQTETGLGALSVEGVSLAGTLVDLIEKNLSDNGVSLETFRAHPELLEDLMRDCVAPSLAALEKNVASAVFLVLDATVNPGGLNADSSRAGLFIRNMAPNAVSHSKPAIYFMRGPIALAREQNMYVLPQWNMEFSTSSGDFFQTTMEGAKTGHDVTRLYYWNPAEALAGDYEISILLCVPMIASDGTILGVCGFEVNTMLFKIQNSPDTSAFHRVYAMLAPDSGDTLNASRALFAGSYAINTGLEGELRISGWKHGLSAFETSDGARFVGLRRPIRLYPKNAVHGGENWSIALLIPEGDLNAYTASRNSGVTVLLVVLLLFSVIVALLLSHRYLAPLLRAIEQIKNQGSEAYAKTNISEIDDLFAFLTERDAEEDRDAAPGGVTTQEAEPGGATPIGVQGDMAFQEFAQRLQTLSRAERAVFNLYAQGYDAQEIKSLLCLSINTVKTHNKRIYYKLGVNSRKELMTYLHKLEEGGCVIREED